MQNRRINKDDGRGMGEPLNETDSSGDGISVPETYYVQLFNRQVRDSLQRVIQQRQDQPPQYFFSFNSQQTKIQFVPSIVKGDHKLMDCGLNEEMKMELYATGKN